MTHDSELQSEQAVIDVLYGRLDTLRDEARDRLAEIRMVGPSGSPQNRSERDAFATLYEDRIAHLSAVEDRLCFGRLDLLTGDRLYVGRAGLSDSEHTPLLTDWRAPAARAFYSATAASPSGLVSRRHISTRGREVIGLEDDLLDVDALNDSGESSLAGEGALLAALAAKRTGRMGDIVATIQAEQDAVIRAPMAGALVVQGGPGTGKTAVALHRAAYLMYHHRTQLESSGVLLIGPSSAFLRYIDHVLPSLGETGALSTTLGGLVRGIDTSTREHDDVAAVKGRTQMAAVIAAAVRERQRLPRADEDIKLDGHVLTIRRSDVQEAQAKARRDGGPHNEAWKVFVKEMTNRLAAQYIEQLGDGVTDEDRPEALKDIRSDRAIRVALNLCWLPVTPSTLLRDLFSRPHLLDHAARALSATDRALLRREADSPFTDADVPLLDEAAELLGDMPGSRLPAATGPSEEEISYAKQVLSTFGGGGMVSAETLAGRMAGGTSRLTVVERASQDRTWTFGHVVVDEAQELSPMAWRMLVRRCPTRSFTIVGDVAQTAAAAGARWWPEVLDPAFGTHWSLRELTVSYRIPAAVAEAAQAFATAAGLPVSELTAARDVPDAVGTRLTERPAAVAADIAGERAAWLAETGGGQIAVIAPDDLLDAIAQAMGGVEVPDSVEVGVHGARAVKGLEFDAVVVVEPHRIGANPGDLYVALTRPTRRLDLVHSAALPDGLSAVPPAA